MASNHYLEFLGSVWSQLPTEDQERFAELWAGYEQVFAAVYQKFAEVNLNSAVQDLQPYSTERWLPYTFSSANFISRPATITSTQDISLGVSTAARFLLKFKVDGGAPFEVNIQAAGNIAQLPYIVSKINAAAGFTFARGIFDNTVLQLVSPTSGVGSSIEVMKTSIEDANACEFVLGVDEETLPNVYPEFRYPYTLPYANVASIPSLRDAIRDESVGTTLVEGVHYTLEAPDRIVFSEAPPAKMWAARTQIDTETPWNNFGFFTGVYQENSPEYVSIIQGLWYAFWNGPKPINIKRSLYLLFGLPSAAEDATVTEITSEAVNVDTTEYTIETTSSDGVVRRFEVPSGLVPIVAVGDSVARFDPLVSGIEVYDKVNRPGFIEEQIGREGIARFLTQYASTGDGNTDETKALALLEEHTFIPQFSVDAFVGQDIDLRNVKIFLDAIKPLHKSYIFQGILGEFRDNLALSERFSYASDIDVTPTLDSNETTFIASADLDGYETEDNSGLDMDSHGMILGEHVEIEVYSSGLLIDSFSI